MPPALGRGQVRKRLLSLALVAALGTAGCTSERSPAPSAEASQPIVSSPGASPSATVSPASSEPAETGGPPSSPPGEGEAATAVDRILGAEASGVIDGPTALLYRIYAIFGDSRLPAEFAGAWSEDEAALDAAARSLDDLPTTIASELRPYVVRPTDPTSVFFDHAGATAAGPRFGPEIASADTRTALTFSAVACGSNGWGYADGSRAIRVWGRCGPGLGTEQLNREGEIQLVASWMDALWKDEVAYMGRDPIPDEGTADQGMDPALATADAGRRRIDIYVTSTCQPRGGQCAGFDNYAVAWPSPQWLGGGGAQRSSGFIVLNRAMIGTPIFARAALAHEFFHILEGAYNREGTHSGATSNWFVEASATWAQWRFVPEASSIQHETMTQERFDYFQGSRYSLQDGASARNRYWSFTWPLFMSQESAGSVKAAWAAIEGKRSDAEVNLAISAQLPFKSRFRDFAVRTYNQELRPTQDRDLLTLLPELAVGTPRIDPGSTKQDDSVTLHADLPGTESYHRSELIKSLYAVYRPFKVDDDVGRVDLDFSNLVPSGSFDVDALLKIKDKGWERRKLDPGKTTLCRDKAKDNVEELIIVISNHELDLNKWVIGSWTIDTLQTGCAALTGVLTITRESSYLQLDPRLPAERRDEHLTATIVVNMRPDLWAGGYTDGWDPSDPKGTRSSTYTITRTEGASKTLGDCTASYSTASSGTWKFTDQPTNPPADNGITGFVDRASGLAGFSIVVHYPYRVTEDICNYITPANTGVHDAYICLDAHLEEVANGPDLVKVHCESDTPDMGYSKTHFVMDGTLTLLDEN